MNKNIAFFGGQGSQFVGMAQEVLENKKALEIYEIGKSITGIDIINLSQNSDIDTLSKTINSQISIFALSLAKFYSICDISFSGVCGFSLGEIAALVASEVISLEDGFRLVLKRGEVMQEAADTILGEMYAVVGLDAKTVVDICENIDGVYPVNFNTKTQIVISGDPQALQTAYIMLKQANARRILKLPVSGAFHTPFMDNAGDKLADFAKTIQANTPKLDFYTNITGEKMQKIDLSQHLKTHMTSPVKFVNQVENIVADGYTNYAEFGAKPTLSSFIKSISKDLQAI